MKIDRALNLIIPIEQEDGSEIYVHSTPIAEIVFKRYHIILAQLWARIFTQGLGYVAGPRVAAYSLEEIAKAAEKWDGPDGVENGLWAEIIRLTNVIIPGKDGWQPVPYYHAKQQGLISESDASQIANALAFFTAVSLVQPPQERKAVLDGAVKIWGGQIVSSNCTEFARSLPTSTAIATSSPPAQVSSIPS